MARQVQPQRTKRLIMNLSDDCEPRATRSASRNRVHTPPRQSRRLLGNYMSSSVDAASGDCGMEGIQTDYYKGRLLGEVDEGDLSKNLGVSRLSTVGDGQEATYSIVGRAKNALQRSLRLLRTKVSKCANFGRRFHLRHKDNSRIYLSSVLFGVLLCLIYFLPVDFENPVELHRTSFSLQSAMANVRQTLLSLPDALFSELSHGNDIQEMPGRGAIFVNQQTVVSGLISDPQFRQLVLELSSQLLEERVRKDEEKQARHIEAISNQLEEERRGLNEIAKAFHYQEHERGSIKEEIDEIMRNIKEDSASKLEQLHKALTSLRSELLDISQSAEGRDDPHNVINELEAKIEVFSAQLEEMRAAYVSCQSRFDSMTVEMNSVVEHVASIVLEKLQGKNFEQTNDSLVHYQSDELKVWMTENLISSNLVEERLEEMQKLMELEIRKSLESRVQQEVMTSLPRLVQEQQDQLLTRKEREGTVIKEIVRHALVTYDADKTGLFDFALESAGGTIVTTRCTELYDVSTAVYSLWGVPFWWKTNSPRVILEPSSNPGQCWAFKGSTGSVVIRLSGAIFVSAVSLEHIPARLSPSGNIASAPRDFLVYGLEEVDDENPFLLGNFTYVDNPEGPVQTFAVNDHSLSSFRLIELKVLNNHGHEAYTCIYRFRVHGHLADEKWKNLIN